VLLLLLLLLFQRQRTCQRQLTSKLVSSIKTSNSFDVFEKGWQETEILF
jgi:hypothetical protein